MRTARKPIYPILPSVMTAREEITDFLQKGRVFFPDEVVFGNALARVFHTPAPATDNGNIEVNVNRIRKLIDSCPGGYLSPSVIQGLMDACGFQEQLKPWLPPAKRL